MPIQLLEQHITREELWAEIQALKLQLADAKNGNMASPVALTKGGPVQDWAENYRALVEHSETLMMTLSLAGTILEINHLPEGLENSNVIGQQCWAFFAKGNEQKIQQAIQKVVQTHHRQNFQVELFHPYGKTICYESTLCPVLEAGTVKRLLLVNRDITSHTHAVSRLRESERHLRMIYNSTHDFISILDEEGRFEFINRTVPPQRPQDLWGSHIWDFSPPESAEKIRFVVQQAVETQKPVHYESETLTSAGQQLWFSSIIHPVLNEQGQVENLVVFSREVSELKAAQITLQEANEHLEERVKQRTQQLERANEEILHFAYIVSHDLRVPLVNLNGFTSEIELSLQDLREELQLHFTQLPAEVNRILGEDLTEALYYIDKSTKRMSRLIDAILKLARIGRTPLEIESVDLGKVLANIHESISHQLTMLGGKMELDALPAVVGDRRMLEQIFANILDNAIKYCHPKRPLRIQVSATRKNEQHIIRVQDNGIGMEKKDFGQIFQIFRRAGNTNIPGEGMGLAYVKSLMTLLDGEIWVESVKGKGSSFLLRFPAIPQDADRTACE